MSKRDSQSIFMSSITDLMTSLAVVFVILLVVHVNHARAEALRLKRMIENLESRTQGSLSIKDKLRARLREASLPFENDTEDALALEYSAPESRLKFAKNSHILDSRGERYLEEFIPRMMGVVALADMWPHVESILVIGYTDSSGVDEYNLKLSQARAFSVLEYSLNNCGLDSRNRERFLELTSISGRGERDLLPRGVVSGHEDQDASRRVQFKIRVRSIEQSLRAGQMYLGE